LPIIGRPGDFDRSLDQVFLDHLAAFGVKVADPDPTDRERMTLARDANQLEQAFELASPDSGSGSIFGHAGLPDLRMLEWVIPAKPDRDRHRARYPP
jgi:hypothetical protein